jgi:hypothetical protein
MRGLHSKIATASTAAAIRKFTLAPYWIVSDIFTIREPKLSRQRATAAGVLRMVDA